MAGQDVEIPKHYQPQLATNVEHLLQKSGSLLRDATDPGDYKGESGEVVKQFGKTKARKNDDRQGDTPIMSTPRDIRWVWPDLVEWGDLLDRADQLRMLIDPTSPLTVGATMAMGRSLDEDIIVPAFFGDAKTGKNGTTTESWAAGATNNVGIQVGITPAADTGMNVGKLIKARRLARALYWNMEREPIYVGLSSQEEEDLLNDIKFTSRDYGEPVLDNGRLKRYLGFEFKVMEEWPLNAAGTIRYLPVWPKSGIHLGAWNQMSAQVGKDPGKKFNVRIYLWQMFGATRTQKDKVIRIESKVQ